MESEGVDRPDPGVAEPAAADPAQPESVAAVPPEPADTVEPRTHGSPRLAAGAVAVGIVGVLAVVLIAVVSGAGRGEAEPSETAAPSPEPAFAVDGASIGFASAPITIEIWADYQCPYCGLFAHGVAPSLVREYAATGEALVTFRDFAFLGQESTDAAVAARCAGRDGKFWRYHDLLFASQRAENQGAFGREPLLGLARFAGVELEPFTACLDDAAVAAEVAAETAEGKRLGVSSTPSVRIVGPGGSEILTGLTDPATIAAAIGRQAADPSPSSSP